MDELICYVQFGYLPHESIMKTIEIIGKEVLPEIEKYERPPGMITSSGKAPRDEESGSPSRTAGPTRWMWPWLSA